MKTIQTVIETYSTNVSVIADSQELLNKFLDKLENFRGLKGVTLTVFDDTDDEGVQS
jgi:hypothetical protein